MEIRFSEFTVSCLIEKNLIESFAENGNNHDC